jgi:hypothetical protein
MAGNRQRNVFSIYRRTHPRAEEPAADEETSEPRRRGRGRPCRPPTLVEDEAKEVGAKDGDWEEEARDEDMLV